MFCYKCGVKNIETNEFCIGCGSRIIDFEDEFYDETNKKKIPNYLIFSILMVCLNLFFCCIVMGIIPFSTSIIAMVYSMRVNIKYKNFDFKGAKECSENAKLWIKISFGLMLLFIFLSIVLIAVVVIFEVDMNSIREYINEYQNYIYERNQQ